MRQLIKNFLWVGFLASGLQASWGFSPGGPIANGGDAWQSPVIGYGLTSDLNAPKNIGEEYRRNTPVMYYTYNANFLDFYGSNGIVAIEQAFSIMNESLTNVDSYSSTLTEFPLNSQAVNYQASALNLVDLKSMTLLALMEQMGLTDPIRYAWTLHNRVLPPNTQCPAYQYLVVQRNLDNLTPSLNQVLYSPYVNGTLYTYFIQEFCPASVPNPQAFTVPVQVDPLADTYPVASEQLFTGGFYFGLTRDDMAGLRYLLTTNNMNWESPASGSLVTTITTNLNSQIVFPPNPNSPSGFGTFDLSALTSAARVTDPAILPLLFPGVIVATSSNYQEVVETPNVSLVAKAQNGAPIGSPPKFVLVTNGVTYSSQTIYVTTFANVVTNHARPNMKATLQTVSLKNDIGAPFGSPFVLVTNTTTVTLTNITGGDYYTLSPDLCPLNLIRVLYTNVVTVTNLLTTFDTNFVLDGTTFVGSFSQSLITSFTNYAYLAHPVDCTQTTPTAGLYQGIRGMKFMRADFDSLLGQFFRPVTNNYTMTLVTNSQTLVQKFQRVVTAPDFLFSAEDLAVGPAVFPVVVNSFRRNLNFDEANVYPGLAGPGTITPSTTVTFDKVGTIYQNVAGGDELTAFPALFNWSSFDGSTNAPVIYPNGTSLDNLANQVLVQVAPATLPNGTKGVSYPATTFTSSGGAFSAPYTWSLATGSGLPAGLTLSSGGTLSGTPTQSGTFDFILQLTDSLSRSVQWNYSIIIQ